MNLSYEKLLAAVSMALVTFISSMLPLLLVKRIAGHRNTNFRVVSFLSCFGGGVFMATCLLHLFPDVQNTMVSVFKKLNIEMNYPAAEFLLCFGFLLVLIVEQIVLNCQESSVSEELPIISHKHSHSEPYQNYGAINENPEPHSHNIAYIPNRSLSVSAADFEPNDNPASHDHEVSLHQDQSSHSILRSLLLVFALSLHSVFEGLAIGLQSSTDNVLRILFAVLVHKCIIAFTLGLNLTHSKLRRSGIIKGNMFFSLTSPIGIIIGLVVVDFVSGLPMLITSGVLQGLAAGTFLYVTFFEVLPHELNSSEDRMIKMFCLVLGFSVVSVLLLVLPDSD